MVTKTNGAADIDAMLAQLEKMQQQEIERLEDQIVEKRVQLEVARRMKALEEQPKRSRMTAAEKSAYIRARGLDEYQKLDWT